MAFRNIALFGAGGANIGAHILQALIKDGTFNTTVIARASSKTSFPSSINVIRIADDLPSDQLVQAFKGQDVVIVTTGWDAHQLHYKLIDAAVEAGVRRFIPSEWGMDNADVKNQELNPIFNAKGEVERYLRGKESERFSWTAVATSIWLEWALKTDFMDIDVSKHTAKYWANGTNKFTGITLAYSAQGTLELLKRPELAVNQRIFFSPFEASQQDIVAELERQQGVKYHTSEIDGYNLVQELQANWKKTHDATHAYWLVTAGLLLPEFGAGFDTAGKQPRLEEVVDMPTLTLEDVVREVVEAKAVNSSV